MAEYSGKDNLDVMAVAEKYNQFLLKLVCAAAQGFVSVLDFGAGRGQFAAGLSAFGLKVVCVETDSDYQVSLSAMGHEVYSSVEQLLPASVDCVYSLNVLEHIENDAAALAELYRVLRPGGALLVYVPALPVLYTSMDSKVGHYRRYTRKSLLSLVAAAGFVPERCVYVDSLGVVATLIYKFLGSKEGDINVDMLGLYDKYVFPISRLLDLIFSSWIGKNVYVIAHKNP